MVGYRVWIVWNRPQADPAATPASFAYEYPHRAALTKKWLEDRGADALSSLEIRTEEIPRRDETTGSLVDGIVLGDNMWPTDLEPSNA